MLYSCFI